MESIKVFSPASVSNVGPGFDIMGFALHQPGDEVIVKKSNLNKIEITKISGDNGRLPLNPNENTTTVGIQSLLKDQNINVGLKIEIHKKMGIGSGLGSSAASAVAGVFAVNSLLNLNLSNDELLKHCMAGEYVASKAFHADNVAPALYGGFILIRDYNPIDIIKIDLPSDLYCSILYPDIEIKTCEARKILKPNVKLKTAISQAGNSAGLIVGFMKNDFELISRSLVDHLAEPFRSKLIPGYDKIRDAALNVGAINCNITGSGPSMFAFSTSESDALKIVRAMKNASSKFTKSNKTYVSKINLTGPKIL
ncbi:MAG: homoserine kinase [Ignavibacteriae bacterium HGW-Ignavibacteriae-2]|nr:MAG: homoserine kinase [Ignavibacteriae bacterium HGW-Ignavibacteriae-2]